MRILKTYDRSQELTAQQARLFDDNLPLARYMAARLPLPFADAYTLTLEALEIASRKYKGTGCKFGTFASYSIRNHYYDWVKTQTTKRKGCLFTHESLDAVLSEGGLPVAELIPCSGRLPSEQAAIDDEIYIVGLLVRQLERRKLAVITHRYGLWGERQQNQEEVAIRLGLSKSRVGQLENEALTDLREGWRALFTNDHTLEEAA